MTVSNGGRGGSKNSSLKDFWCDEFADYTNEDCLLSFSSLRIDSEFVNKVYLNEKQTIIDKFRLGTRNDMSRIAFTLAEILITLGIIGIVAAMTLPSLIADYKAKQTVTAVKKTYSVLSGAYNMSIAENGSPDSWGWGESNSTPIGETLIKYFKKIKYCEGITSGCFSKDTYLSLGGSIIKTAYAPTNKSFKFRLADGSSVAILSWDKDCATNCGSGILNNSMCGYIFVDINGDKGPNKMGIDYFGFLATKTAVVPTGTQVASAACGSLDAHCDLNKISGSNGLGCTAWVISNGNMDYLKHKVSW